MSAIGLLVSVIGMYRVYHWDVSFFVFFRVLQGSFESVLLLPAAMRQTGPVSLGLKRCVTHT